MLIFGYILSLFYFWFGYKIFAGKTFGSFLYQIIIIITFLSLYISTVFFIFTKNLGYLAIPAIPYIVYSIIQDNIRKKMKLIIYKKN